MEVLAVAVSCSLKESVEILKSSLGWPRRVRKRGRELNKLLVTVTLVLSSDRDGLTNEPSCHPVVFRELHLILY